MNEIHETCIIDDNVELGDNNKILPYTIIHGPTKIGNNNIIGPHVVIGAPGQDTRNKYYDSSNSKIEIGDYNIIREFSAIQKPCYKDLTKIGNHIFIMQRVSISHDSIVHDDVVITPMTISAGITTLCKGANIGIGANIHQHSVIGHYSMVGMGSNITKNVSPFTIYVVGKKSKVNMYALKKFELTEYTDEIVKYVQEDIPPISDPIIQIVEEFEELHSKSKRGIYK